MVLRYSLLEKCKVRLEKARKPSESHRTNPDASEVTQMQVTCPGRPWKSEGDIVCSLSLFREIEGKITKTKKEHIWGHSSETTIASFEQKHYVVKGTGLYTMASHRITMLYHGLWLSVC